MKQATLSQNISSELLYPWRPLVEEELAKVNQVILAMTESEATLIPSIARYLINSGGKRIRPIITLLSARMCGYVGERHVRLAAAIEFIHTATLLHDDVVDESKLRRGRTTANEVYGNTASVLVGDFLLSRAFQLMAKDDDIRVLRILSDASAIITEGEVKQLISKQDLSTSHARYIDIISAKTAELFAAAARVGAVVAKRPENDEQALEKFGRNLGIAFQIADDALDYSAAEEQLGKTIGDDFREGKITLPVILAYQQGNLEEKTFWEKALETEPNEEDLARAIDIIKERGISEQALGVAKTYADLAISLLVGFRESPEKQAFIAMTRFAVERQY